MQPVMLQRLSLPAQTRRAASLFIITTIGTFVNSALVVQFLTAWISFRRETESEWESANDTWRLSGLKIVWALLSLYFASGAAVCIVGLVGLIRSKPTFLRFYRDYSIADLAFCAFFSALAFYGTFHASTRAELCEFLSRHGELMQYLQDLGLGLEACEQWLDRAVVFGLSTVFIVLVVRLHFLFAASQYLAHLAKYRSRLRQRECPQQMQRLLLIPKQDEPDADVELVYTPVPLDSLPMDVQQTAREVWVSQATESVSCSFGVGALWKHYIEPHYSAEQSSTTHQTTDYQPRPLMRCLQDGLGDPLTSWTMDADEKDTHRGLIRLHISPDEGLLSDRRIMQSEEILDDKHVRPSDSLR